MPLFFLLYKLCPHQRWKANTGAPDHCGPPRADPGRRNKSPWRSVMKLWLSYSEVCWCKLCKLCAVWILLRARLQERPFNPLQWNYYVIKKYLGLYSFITFCQNHYFLAPAATWRMCTQHPLQGGAPCSFLPSVPADARISTASHHRCEQRSYWAHCSDALRFVHLKELNQIKESSSLHCLCSTCASWLHLLLQTSSPLQIHYSGVTGVVTFQYCVQRLISGLQAIKKPLVFLLTIWV